MPEAFSAKLAALFAIRAIGAATRLYSDGAPGLAIILLHRLRSRGMGVSVPIPPRSSRPCCSRTCLQADLFLKQAD